MGELRIEGLVVDRGITFADLAATRIDVLVRIVRLDGTEQFGRVTVAEPSFAVAARPGAWDVVRTYTVLGVEHILGGVDHLLFVLVLLSLVGVSPRRPVRREPDPSPAAP